MGENLRAHIDDALLSRKVATIQTNAPVELDFEHTAFPAYDAAAVSAALGELGLLPGTKTGTAALVCLQDERFLDGCLRLTQRLREAGIACELYPEAKKLPKQFSYAETKGVPFAVIYGEAEAASGTVTVKDLTKRENRAEISFEEALAWIKREGR